MSLIPRPRPRYADDALSRVASRLMQCHKACSECENDPMNTYAGFQPDATPMFRRSLLKFMLPLGFPTFGHLSRELSLRLSPKAMNALGLDRFLDPFTDDDWS